MTELFWRRCSAATLGAMVVTSLLATTAGGGDGHAPTPAARAVDVPLVTAVPSVSLRSTTDTVRPRPSRTAVARASLSPRPSATATRGTGRLVTVPGESPAVGSGPLQRYEVKVEAGLGVDPAAFATAAHRTLGDRRGWGRDVSFRRVSSGPTTFTLVLAGPALTDRLCRPLSTNGELSCFQRGRAVINVERWREGAPSYGGRVALYRQYVVTHEVGHALRHPHRFSCRPDGLAPVMMQQTKSLYGCRANPWPYP